MPNLASIVMAAWMFVHAQFGLSGVPIPVVIETGREYQYSEIYSSIIVPTNWEGNCYGQKQLVYFMAKYYNSQLNGRQRNSDNRLLEIENKWECVE